MHTIALLSLLQLTLAPIREQILFGTTNSGGNLASWAADDNNPRKVCKLFVPGVVAGYVRLNLTFATDTTDIPKTLEFPVKISDHTPGRHLLDLRILQAQSVFDTTNIYQTPIVKGEIYTALPLHDIERYIQPGGNLVLRIEVWQAGPSTSLFPCVSFEFANAVVTY